MRRTLATFTSSASSRWQSWCQTNVIWGLSPDRQPANRWRPIRRPRQHRLPQAGSLDSGAEAIPTE